MFERYTDRARRAIFFARYEASQVGSPAIESEHILFGLLREDISISSRYLGGIAAEGELRLQVLTVTPARDPTSVSIDLPLSEECRRILAHSNEEATRLGHAHLGNEHLLLGILREQDCLAAKLLSGRGLTIERARAMVMEGAQQEGAVEVSPGAGASARATISPAKVHLINAAISEELGELSGGAPYPRIGESLSILTEGGHLRVFKVQNITWQAKRDAESLRLDAILVSLVEQGPAQQS